MSERRLSFVIVYASYFQRSKKAVFQNRADGFLMFHIFEYIVTDSEMEALIFRVQSDKETSSAL